MDANRTEYEVAWQLPEEELGQQSFSARSDDATPPPQERLIQLACFARLLAGTDAAAVVALCEGGVVVEGGGTLEAAVAPRRSRPPARVLGGRWPLPASLLFRAAPVVPLPGTAKVRIRRLDRRRFACLFRSPGPGCQSTRPISDQGMLSWRALAERGTGPSNEEN